MHDRVNESGAGATRGRILIISPWESVWALGHETNVKAGVSDDDRFIDGFTRAGYELHFLRPQSGRQDTRVVTHTYPNFFRHTRGLPTWLRRPLWPLLFNLIVVARAVALARDLRPVVVMGHSHYATLATWWCRLATRAPSVTKLFGVMDLVHTAWPPAKYLAKNFEQIVAFTYSQDAWIVLDDGTRGGDILRARGIPASRIHFLPNGLNLEWLERRMDRASARSRFGIPADTQVVLFLARLVDSKRPLDMIAAAERVLRAHNTSATFLFAGDGPLRSACEQAARDRGIADNVQFAGIVPHHDVPELMAAADLFVSTSTLTNRALPTCEAMICGVPVLAYDTGDTATVVRDGETGVLVGDGDVTALADAMARLLSDTALRARLAQAAQTLARDTFVSWESRIAMELEIIQALARKQNGRPMDEPPVS